MKKMNQILLFIRRMAEWATEHNISICITFTPWSFVISSIKYLASHTWPQWPLSSHCIPQNTTKHWVSRYDKFIYNLTYSLFFKLGVANSYRVMWNSVKLLMKMFSPLMIYSYKLWWKTPQDFKNCIDSLSGINSISV